MKLNQAIMDGKLKEISKLIKEGVDVEEKIGYFSFTPLCFSIHFRRIKAATLLIEAGAKINNDVDGRTALGCAVERCNLPIVEMLINQGADTNIKHLEKPIIYYALRGILYNCKNKNNGSLFIKIAELLINNNAEINCIIEYNKCELNEIENSESGNHTSTYLKKLSKKDEEKDEIEFGVQKISLLNYILIFECNQNNLKHALRAIKFLVKNNIILDYISAIRIRELFPENIEELLNSQYKKLIEPFFQTSKYPYQSFREIHRGDDYVTDYILQSMRPSYLGEDEGKRTIMKSKESFREKVKNSEARSKKYQIR